MRCLDLDVLIESAVVVDVRLPFSRPLSSRVARSDYKPTVLLILGGDTDFGFGEAPVFDIPIYGEEFTLQTHEAIALFLRQAFAKLAQQSSSGFRIGLIALTSFLDQFIGNLAAKAAIEMAAVDLWARQNQIGGVSAITEYLHACGETNFPVISPNDLDPLGYLHLETQGASLGLDSNLDRRGDELNRLIDLGYRRVKIKFDESVCASDLSHLVDTLSLDDFRSVELSIDANGSFRTSKSVNEVIGTSFSYIETPFASCDLSHLSSMCNEVHTRVCLDEEITSCDRLQDLIDFVGFDIACLKLTRLGGVANMARAISLCRSFDKAFYIGGMYDSPILRRLNALFVAVSTPPEVSDLGPDSDYFDFQIPPSVVKYDINTLAVLGDVGITGAFVPGSHEVLRKSPII